MAMMICRRGFGSGRGNAQMFRDAMYNDFSGLHYLDNFGAQRDFIISIFVAISPNAMTVDKIV